MGTILIIGLSLFLCSAAALFVTMRGATISDLKRKPMRSFRLFPLRRRRPLETTENVALVDRRCLDDHARSIEGAVFFF